MKTRGVYVICPFENPNKTTAYRVAGTTPGGVRIRENYKTQPEALARKQQLEIEALNFTPEKRITTTRLTPAQEAQAERAFADLDGRPMPLAIRFFLDNYREPLKKITVREAFAEFLAAKKNAGLRDASLKGLKTRVGFLVRKFPEKLVSDIQPAHVAEAAAQPGVTDATREDNRRSFSSFFSWSMEKQYGVTNPAKKTIRRRGTRDDVEPALEGSACTEVRRKCAHEFTLARFGASARANVVTRVEKLKDAVLGNEPCTAGDEHCVWHSH